MKYVCVHGHFYQPPRENPWLDAVQREDSAAPYHDWNERITAECYGPNAHARILDGQGRIARIVSNYSRMSFNFGPTLLSWLQHRAPDTYAAILAADAAGAAHFAGHGPALAQAYNHMIMPLADARDKRTQVLWGVADFQHRFGRRSEGMWLPETAVDTSTLETLADADILFTVLAPRQAARVKAPNARTWTEVENGVLDTTRPYWVRLPSGRRISVYFYDGPVSQAVAFEGLLTRGEYLAGRLVGSLPSGAASGSLAHVATDGETYGHHHRFGEMALAWALDHLAGAADTRLTVYGEHLSLHPAEHEVEIVEASSWSCAHGVERWRSDCGCHTGGKAGWTQAWRAPLRESLDWLRDGLRRVYEEKSADLLKDPWAARDAYVRLVLDRAPEVAAAFLDSHAARPLSPADEVQVLRLLELQRHAMLMYTSCGWFFNDLAGLETVQILRYAARAIELAKESGGEDFALPFASRLAAARSNEAAEVDGRFLFERRVLPARADALTAAARHAAASIVEERPKTSWVDAWRVTVEDSRRLRKGEARLAVGRLSVVSTLTRAATQAVYCYLLDKGPLPGGAVSVFSGLKAYEAMLWETTNLFFQGDFTGVRAAIERHFPEGPMARKGLSADEERRLAELLLSGAASQAEAAFIATYEREAPMLRALAERGIPAPKALSAAAEFALNARVRRILESETPDLQEAEKVLAEFKMESVRLDEEGLAYALGHLLRRLAEAVLEHPFDLRAASALSEAAGLASKRAPGADLWTAQNEVWDAVVHLLPERLARAQAGDAEARVWCQSIVSAAYQLNIKV
ncbi:MAG: DUF3536 domain-containing protein [Elusimicrobia bacterium]|nr:DUF3536 domain-containing protein [Elusimicrobiota bacterium]